MQSIRKMTCSLKDLSYVIWEKISIIHKSMLIRFLLWSLEWKVSYQGHWCGPRCYIHCSIPSPHLLVLPATSDKSDYLLLIKGYFHLPSRTPQPPGFPPDSSSSVSKCWRAWNTFPSSCTWYFLQVLFASLMAISASLKLWHHHGLSPQNPVWDI